MVTVAETKDLEPWTPGHGMSTQVSCTQPATRELPLKLVGDTSRGVRGSSAISSLPSIKKDRLCPVLLTDRIDLMQELALR